MHTVSVSMLAMISSFGQCSSFLHDAPLQIQFILAPNIKLRNVANVYRSLSICDLSKRPFEAGIKRKRARDLTLEELKLELNSLMEPFATNSSRLQLIDLLNTAKDPRRKRAVDINSDRPTSDTLKPSKSAASDEFAEYYRQQLCLNETEMKLLLQYLATPLPISFRLNVRCSPLSADDFDAKIREIGRASCRERVCQYV